MILADTSVWIDHFRAPKRPLAQLLLEMQILCHHMVIGELAVGNLPNRASSLRELERLPSVLHARHHEVLLMIEDFALFGRGVGYNDAHLLASARLSRCWLWTRDKRLAAVARELGVEHSAGA